MDLNYLLSIIDLYLLKELNDHLVIDMYDDDVIKIECSYASSSLNKTYIKINKDDFFNNINYIITKIQGNLNIKNESYENDTYKVIFDNNREIKFILFNNDDLTKIRNNFNNLNNNFSFNKVEINNNINYNQIYNETKQTNLKHSFGFSGFITIFLMSIWFLDIFMIALWIFKIIK